MNISQILAFPLLAATAHSFAADLPAGDRRSEQAAESVQQHQWLETLQQDSAASAAPNEAVNVRQVNDEELARNPALLEEMLQQAVNSNHPPLLEALTAVYRRQPQADKVLLARAESMVARNQGDYPQALETYGRLNRQHPQDARIALDYAALLFEDKQWQESDRLFAQTAQTANLPEAVADNIRRYRAQIDEADDWQLNGGLSVSYDRNINNAAPAYCTYLGCTTEQAENATGIHYHAELEKNTPLKGHHNLTFRNRISGTSYYLDKKSQYDHAFGRSYLGWYYQNARSSLSVLPFYQAQLAGSNEFADKPTDEHTLNMNMFAHAVGVQTAWSHRITPRLQAYASGELYRQSYRPQQKSTYYDGRHAQLFGSLAYQLGANDLVFAGYGNGTFRPKHTQIDGRTNHTAHTRHSLSAGWFAAWPTLGGLASRLRAGYTDRRYKGRVFNTDFTPERQRNKETFFSASLAHPKISYHGIMPRLTFEHSRTRSTHKWAEQKQSRLFVELEKSF
ncbi:DUF560 domain-containing protein [Neisseria brasiliensis]|uniref:surface lipoprotein assembly modifier n=1 Tax=Neisseria TaxID=482 RepID=UPI000C26EA92|nr:MULTISPECIES: surface lipoprotein assembly modifier [Neisseria]PJO77102.1 hypothetical protein CWC45_12290 [Neisseria sp. N177_16]QGL24747.1 DUF560 domain-containing protein [Neisseria brasiliensis]